VFALAPAVGPLPASFVDVAPLVGPLPTGLVSWIELQPVKSLKAVSGVRDLGAVGIVIYVGFDPSRSLGRA
jgi:hypothetical protein